MPKYFRAGRSTARAEAALLENMVNVLHSVIIDAILDAPTVHDLFRVPDGKQAVITSIIAHSNTATLVGMIDVNFGGGVAAITPVWKDAVSLTSMTTADMMLEIIPAGAVIIIDGDDSTVANRTLRAQVVTGSTGAANVTLDVMGYLINS